MRNKKNVCAIIVTHNRINLLKKCIDAIESQEYPCDVFVVNNNSTDGTDKYLIEKEIKHLSLSKNTGGAGGFNIGIKECIKKEYKYLWLMDDDCIPNVDSLQKLMDASNKLNNIFGFLSSKVLWKDLTIHKMNEIHYKEKVCENIYKIKQGTFVSLLLKTEVIKRVGLPIKDFFIWGDDIEYTRRIAIINNIESYYVENSVVLHDTEDNNGSKIAFDDIKRINRYRYAYRNERFLYKREGFKGKFYYFTKCIYNLLRIMLFAKNHKFTRIRIMLEGIEEGRRFNPKIELLQ